MTLFPLIAAITPAVVCAIYIYTRDKSAPEPIKLLLKAFGYGLLSVPIVIFALTPLMHLGIVPEEAATFWDSIVISFLGAAIPEELAKFLFLWLIIRKHRKEFDQHIDAVVYAAFISLGFATLENIMYVVGSEEGWFEIAVARAFLSVPGHMLFGVIMGYFATLALFSPENSRRYWTMAIVGPITAHGLYDVLAISSSVVNEYLAGLLSWVLIFFVIRLWKLCTKSIQRHNQADDRLRAEAEKAKAEAEEAEVATTAIPLPTEYENNATTNNKNNQ